MTVRKAEFDDLPKENLVNGIIKWSSLGEDDEGDWVKIGTLADKTIHIFGVFGATVKFEGSNESGVPTAPVTLVDPQGNQISATSRKMEVILENPVQMRPVITGGDVNTDVTVIICAKGGLR